MIDAKEARRVCDKSRAGHLPFEIRYFYLINDISDKIKFAAVSGFTKIELSFTSIGFSKLDERLSDLEKYLRWKKYAVKVISNDPHGDAKIVISW